MLCQMQAFEAQCIRIQVLLFESLYGTQWASTLRADIIASLVALNAHSASDAVKQLFLSWSSTQLLFGSSVLKSTNRHIPRPAHNQNHGTPSPFQSFHCQTTDLCVRLCCNFCFCRMCKFTIILQARALQPADISAVLSGHAPSMPRATHHCQNSFP